MGKREKLILIFYRKSNQEKPVKFTEKPRKKNRIYLEEKSKIEK